MHKYFSFVLLLVLFFVSCSNNNNDASEFRSIALDPAENALPLDSIFDSYKIFQVKDSLFGRITTITETGDNLLIRVQHDKYGYLLFDTESDNSRALAIKGRGPGEFWTIGYPEVTENGFYLPDRMNKRVSEYNSMGEIVRVIEVPLLFDKLLIQDYPIIYTYKSLGDNDEKTRDFEIVVRDLEENQSLGEFISLDNDIAIERGIAGYNPLIRINDEIVLCRPLCDTVYNIHQGGISPRYIFDTGRRSIPQGDINNQDIGLGDFFRSLQESDYIWFYMDYMENKSQVYFAFTYNKNRYFAFYNKKSGVATTSNRVIDNIIFGKQFTYGAFTPVGMGNNCMYFSVDPVAVLNNESIPGLNLQPEMLKSLKEDDNKLIVKLNFK